MQGSGFRVQGSGFRVQGSGVRVQGTGCRLPGAGTRKMDVAHRATAHRACVGELDCMDKA